MFARVMHIQAKPGKLDDVVAMYWESVAPALRTQEGFQSTFLLTDPGNDKGLSVTVWKSATARAASAASAGFLQQVGKVAPLLAGLPVGEDMVMDSAGPSF